MCYAKAQQHSEVWWNNQSATLYLSHNAFTRPYKHVGK
jgi:hypothetical protein